jgi:outer membrane receptor protein involved in Fe transport
LHFTIRLAAGALATILAAAAPALASDHGTIHGAIANQAGKPISGARVVATSSRTSYAATTDANGSFLITDIPEGVYTLGATARGYQRITGQVVSVIAGRESEIQLVLSPQTAAAMATIGRVAVNGSRALSTASAPTTDLDPQDLAGRGVEQLSSVLSEQVALTMTRQLGGAPGLPQSASIRGPDPSETVIDVDGHQVNNSNTGDFDLELLDPSEFAGVQIVYGIGPSSLVGANTQGGAINFRTIEPTTDDRGLLRFSAGSFGTFGETAQATGTDGNIGYAISWHHYTTQGEVRNFAIATDSSGTLAYVGSGINSVSSLAKFRYSLANGLGFAELTYRDTAASRDVSAALSRPDDPTNTSPGAPFTAVHAPGAAVLTNSPAFGLDLQLPVGGLDASGSSTATIVARHLTSTVAESTPNIDPALNPYLIDQHDRVSDDSVEYDRYASGATFTLEGDVRHEQLTAPVVLAPGPSTQSQTQRSIVGRAIWSPTGHLHYTAAAYVSRYDTFGSSIDPRLALVWTPTASSVVRASIGTGFRAPLLAERVFNPALTAERTTEYELGYETRIGAGDRPATAVLNLYRTNLRDPIFFTVDSTGALTFLENLGHVVYEGAEFRYSAPLSTSMTVSANYGIDIAYPVDNPFAFDPAAPNVVAGEQFQGIPPHKATLALAHTSNDFVQVIDAAYESANNELNRPAYVMFDATVSRMIGRTQVALTARNLTNRFDDKFTLPGAGTPYPAPGAFSPTDAFSVQGRSFSLTVTQRL